MTSRLINILFLFCFLLMINCTSPLHFTALISMIGAQEKYFESEIVIPFVNEHNAVIDILSYSNMDSLQYEIKKNSGKICIIKIPFSKSRSLIEEGLIMPINDIITPEELKHHKETYMLNTLAEFNDKTYFIPRKFETRLMVYLKSKVIEAVSVWRRHRVAIHDLLKLYNGFGLPATYILEEDPNKWDYYDIFVVGWIWANTSSGGKVIPRIAHRGKAYSGTSHRIIDRAFQCGADSAEVVRMEGNAVVDAFHWEAIYAHAGIYNKKMWEDGWSGSGVWDGFKSGDVFLSFMTQLDCFFIHGTGRDGLDGFLSNPDDLGFATMPQGCSFNLSNQGELLRKGTKSITTGGWYWGIPKKTPDPRMSYAFALHITNMKNQVQGCSRFGMIPVRKDVLSDMQMLFGGDWISKMYNASFEQLMHNKSTMIPTHPAFYAIQNLYLDAWFDIVVKKNWNDIAKKPSHEYIASIISKRYSNFADELLK